MAYNKKKILKQALKAIEENNLFYIEDVIAYVSCSRSTFWAMFPDGSDELDILKSDLNANKITTKVDLRRQMFEANTPTDRVALYKLIGTDEEVQRLSSTKQTIDANLNHSGEIIIKPPTKDGN